MQVRMTYSYKLYQNKKLVKLDLLLGIAAEIWNHCIALHRKYYKWFGKHLSANRLKVFITKLRNSMRYRHWKLLNSQAVQDIVERIERSYEKFFDHCKQHRKGRCSPPKFRKRKNYKSFTLKQTGYKFLDNENAILLSVGKEKIRFPFFKNRMPHGTIKTVTVKKNRLGEWFLYLSCVEEIPDIPTRTDNAVGMDFGLKHFLTLDNGETINCPEFLKQSLSKLRKAHRAVSLCEKGSNNRKRALANLERISEKVANQRRDWSFKLAASLCERYDIICIEDLNIAAMQRLWGRKISDYGFSEFVRILEWEAVKHGCQVIKIDRWAPSSKACHVCGTLTEETKDLSVREWTCECCGAHHDRDVNAAINIRNMGAAMVA